MPLAGYGAPVSVQRFPLDTEGWAAALGSFDHVAVPTLGVTAEHTEIPEVSARPPPPLREVPHRKQPRQRSDSLTAGAVPTTSRATANIPSPNIAAGRRDARSTRPCPRDAECRRISSWKLAATGLVKRPEPGDRRTDYESFPPSP